MRLRRDPRPVLWGGRRGDAQIGSREDLWAAQALAREWRLWHRAEGLRALYGEIGGLLAYQEEVNALRRERAVYVATVDAFGLGEVRHGKITGVHDDA